MARNQTPPGTPRLLAALGGQPAFSSVLHVGRPNLGERAQFMELANGMFDRLWLSNQGPLVQQFEERLRALLGVRHCSVFCNATIALEVVIRALGLQGEVIVPSFTFIASVHSLWEQGIRPVFCDIDPNTHNLDPAAAARLVTSRTSAILGVHLWGRPCPVDDLQALAGRHGLKLLFDAAHAFGCSTQGRMIGNFGEAEVFSFHATKYFNSFEGGAVATNNEDLAARLRQMRNFGFQGYDHVVSLGTNGKMTEVCAAMGLTNLNALEGFCAVNRRNYDLYQRALEKIPGFRLLRFNEQEKCNYQYIVVEIDEQQAGLHRDHFLQVLHLENVLARRYFWPGCHRMEPYRTLWPQAGGLLPNTEAVAGRVLVLPTGTAIGADQVAVIAGILRTAIDNRDLIRHKVPLDG